jgi:O-antigen/teichoic acid export membrane protein
MNKIKDKIVSVSNNVIGLVNDEKRIGMFRHVKNYLSAELIVKAIGLISIPIFTRLLSPEEYGVYAIFLSFVAVMNIISSLNMHTSVDRYYFEEKGNFASFVGSNIFFVLLFQLLLIVYCLFWGDWIKSFFEISDWMFWLGIIASLSTFYYNVLVAILKVQKRSFEFSVISVSKNLFIFILSIIWVVFLPATGAMGRIYGYVIATLFFLIYALYKLIKLSNFQIQYDYIKYSALFALPLVPHSLSKFILATFDRVMINKITGVSDVGLYTLAYQIGSLIAIVISAVSSSLVPFFYEKMNDKDYGAIKEIADKYSSYICFFALNLIIYSGELLAIVADEAYAQSAEVIPIVTMSYVMIFFYSFYANYSFYYKRTIAISLSTLLAGVINILLNSIFIPRYGYQAAAYTTLLSYLALCLFHYINCKWILQVQGLVPLKSFYKSLILTIVFVMMYYVIRAVIVSSILLFVIKLFVSILALKYLVLDKRPVS